MIYIIYALILLMVFQDYMNRKERRKLVEAIMAKDLKEFKDEPEKPVKSEPVPMPDIPVDQASPDEFDRGIRAELGTETTADKAKRFVKGKHGK